jgi:hypothetical protein
MASRTNGRKSKGPVTEHGKAMVRASAGKHWRRAEGIRELMPALGEDPADFDQVRDGLYRCIRPQDAFEEMVVDDLAEIHWRLRRMLRGEAAEQARGRRESMRRQDELDARFESGKFHDLERSTIPTMGFVGLEDSPVKFRRILEILRTLADLVRYGGFQGEVVVFLQQLYGYNPSERAVKVMNIYDRCYKERDSADEAQTAANQAAFQEAVADEIAWFEKRAANHLQARAELRAPVIESGLLNVQADLGKVMLYQDRLERAFDRKWKLLVNYRSMHPPGEDLDIAKTVDVKPQDEEQTPEGEHPSERPQLSGSNGDGRA